MLRCRQSVSRAQRAYRTHHVAMQTAVHVKQREFAFLEALRLRRCSMWQRGVLSKESYDTNVGQATGSQSVSNKLLPAPSQPGRSAPVSMVKLTLSPSFSVIPILRRVLTARSALRVICGRQVSARPVGSDYARPHFGHASLNLQLSLRLPHPLLSDLSRSQPDLDPLALQCRR